MSFPRYPEYKDSGVQWLGEVPEHWQLARIRSFTRFCGGGTPSRENPNYWNGDIPWVSPKDMKVERIAGAEEYVTEDGLAASTSSMIDEGSLLIVVRSGILKHTIPVAINDRPVALNQDMKALRFAKGSATSDFFLRWVQGLNDLLLLAWAKQGATVESIEHSYLAETIVPLPLPAEQDAITAFLDRETAKIDTLIAEQEKLLALLAEKRQATISHAVTRGLDPNAPMKDSGIPWLGEVPAHWDVTRFKQAALSIEQGWSPQCENFPVEEPEEWGVLKVGCVNGGAFDAKENKKLPPEFTPLSEYALKAGDLLISRANTKELVGSAAVVPFDFDRLLLCDKLYRLRLALDVCLPNYAAAVLGTREARSQVEIAATGASSSMLNIGQSVVLNLPLPLPAVDEQRAIIDFLQVETGRLHTLSNGALRAIALLKERRSALIAAAVTGKIDVRGEVPIEEQAA
ncbi:restriction endonuclease subunit S [Luteimonas sp. BDR2-5]|uniref:restriction endonuclease subunit S n=1 Tax=Proluteimonas luteida TaxID=2878685 RepID=UPI001E46E87F|nr:restriction endonuclease subunit S [Luteimonas sp. BDR2-5]MCD9028565.1 restriction endonuclease subunit S [Luteimonas sp. BDR2-5]